MVCYEPVEVVEIPTTGALVLRVSGEIDLSTMTATGRMLAAAGATLPPPGVIVVDLSQVAYLSAAGVRALVAFALSIAERGVSTRLVAARHTVVHRLLRIADLGKHLPVFDTVDEALHTGP